MEDFPLYVCLAVKYPGALIIIIYKAMDHKCFCIVDKKQSSTAKKIVFTHMQSMNTYVVHMVVNMYYMFRLAYI